MAQTEFSETELRNRLFFEIIKHPDGERGKGFVEFHGFYTEDAMINARSARQMLPILRMMERREGGARMSLYLRFLAELFDDSEGKPEPDETLRGLCGEVPIRQLDMTNWKCGRELGGIRFCQRQHGHPGECSDA